MLWDIDYTLVQSGRTGLVLYETVLADLYGVDLPGQLTSMAGRTDSAIALEVLAAAGLDAPAELPRFHRALAKRAGEEAGRSGPLQAAAGRSGIRQTGRVFAPSAI